MQKVMKFFVVFVAVFIASLFMFQYNETTGNVTFKSIKNLVSSKDNSASVVSNKVSQISYNLPAISCTKDKCTVYKITKLNAKNKALIKGNKYIGYGSNSFVEFIKISGLSQYGINSDSIKNTIKGWWILDLEGTTASDIRDANSNGAGARPARTNFQPGERECKQDLGNGISLSRQCNPGPCGEDQGTEKKDRGKELLEGIRTKLPYTNPFTSSLTPSDTTQLQSNPNKKTPAKRDVTSGFPGNVRGVVDSNAGKAVIFDQFSVTETYTARGVKLIFAHSISVTLEIDSVDKTAKSKVDHSVHISVIDAEGSLFDIAQTKVTPATPDGIEYIQVSKKGESSLAVRVDDWSEKDAEKFKEKAIGKDVIPEDPDTVKNCGDGCESVKEIRIGRVNLVSPLALATRFKSVVPTINPGQGNTGFSAAVRNAARYKDKFNVDYENGGTNRFDSVCLDNCGRLTECTIGNKVKAFDFMFGVPGIYEEVSYEKFMTTAGGYTDPQVQTILSNGVTTTTNSAITNAACRQNNQGNSQNNNQNCNQDGSPVF